MTLVEFLKARLDEDAAEIAQHPDGEDAIEDWQLAARSESNYPCDPYLAIAKKRALGEVEAKRRIIDECERKIGTFVGTGAQVATEYLVLRLLAQPYADHPDYDPVWRV